jgi:uncharacterized membrane protein YozB (DUF420 family)
VRESISECLAAFSLESLPVVNAALNATAAVLLAIGYVLIKRRREVAHRRVMYVAFATSVLFLGCYLAYHFDLKARTGASGRPFGGPPPISYVYYTILITHVFLAVTVPVLASWTIYLGLRDYRTRHRRLAQWTFPIWMYVSVTGVVIYLMLYHLYPAAQDGATIPAPAGAALTVPR